MARAVVINIGDAKPEEIGHYVQYVGRLLDEGFTSGHTDGSLNWSIEEAD